MSATDEKQVLAGLVERVTYTSIATSAIGPPRTKSLVRDLIPFNPESGRGQFRWKYL
jgi:hypothetical protein